MLVVQGSPGEGRKGEEERIEGPQQGGEAPSRRRQGRTPAGSRGLSYDSPLPPKLYKIGEVMRFTGLSRQTIHNYTMLGLITEEERTPSGHRLYGESVFHRLRRIQELKSRHSLKEVREILERGEE
ncbi:MAG: MerR family DNA-binding transcriptional regulator [Planctomycetota bacterium]